MLNLLNSDSHQVPVMVAAPWKCPVDGGLTFQCLQCEVGSRFIDRDPRDLDLASRGPLTEDTRTIGAKSAGSFSRQSWRWKLTTRERHRPKVAERLFQCEGCGLRFENRKLLKEHASSHFSGSYEDRYISEETRERTRQARDKVRDSEVLTCQYCRFITSEKKLLEGHNRSCPFVKNKVKLATLQNVRQGQECYGCPFCQDLTFDKEKKLVTHLKVMHHMTSGEIFLNFKLTA